MTECKIGKLENKSRHKPYKIRPSSKCELLANARRYDFPIDQAAVFRDERSHCSSKRTLRFANRDSSTTFYALSGPGGDWTLCKSNGSRNFWQWSHRVTRDRNEAFWCNSVLVHKNSTWAYSVVERDEIWRKLANVCQEQKKSTLSFFSERNQSEGYMRWSIFCRDLKTRDDNSTIYQNWSWMCVRL